MEVSNGQVASLAHAGASLAIPHVPLNLRLNSKLVTETFKVDYIQLYASYFNFLPTTLRQLLPITRSLSLPTYAYPFQNTGITVVSGDQIELSANGTWNCGLGATGPSGNNGKKDDNTPVPNANLCALVGVIGNDRPDAGSGFLIGESKQIVAAKGGALYLGSNENLGECDGSNRGSCYHDNQGALSVSIVVRRN